MKKHSIAAVVLAMMLTGGMNAYGLINPNFTPVHLLRSAELVVRLQVGAVQEDGERLFSEAKVMEAFVKGDEDPVGQTTHLDMSYLTEQHKPRIKQILNAQDDSPVLLFSGRDQGGEAKGFLHLSGQWLEIEPSPDHEDTWEIVTLDARSGGAGSMGMEATWAGGTDMLLKVVRLLIEHPDLDVPVDGGTSWETHMKIANIPGDIYTMAAVDISSKGENALFIGAENGDRVFTWNPAEGSFDDATEAQGLTSKSRVAAWGNFAGNGRLDLISWDGEVLSLWVQDEAGTFAAHPLTSDPPAGPCLSLQPLEVGVGGKAGLLWTGPDAATVMIPDAETLGQYRLERLSADPKLWSVMAPVGQGLAADFTTNGVVDILVVGEGGSVFFAGKKAGEFEAGQACAVSSGAGFGDAFLGDWNADGLLDVFTLSKDSCRLWQNEGSGSFRDLLSLSGEIEYITSPGGIMGNTSDFNNDGRQDIFIAYGRDTGPQLFFNRFFRSFGHAHQPVDIAELGVLPEVARGQQAGIQADFTHSGTQDMAFAQRNGDVYVFIRDVNHGSRLGVTVALPPNAGHSGPVRVWADNGTFPLGAWSVLPGTDEAMLGMEDPGPIHVYWQFPGQEAQTATKLVERGETRMTLSFGQ